MSIDASKAVIAWEHAGLKCVAMPHENWVNGYVQLPEGHLGRKAGYDTLNRAISVHGGLTYGTDENGWVGFDTAHGGDYWPGLGDDSSLGREVAWSLEKLVAEVNHLAEQLATLTELPFPEDTWNCTDAEWRQIAREAKAWRRLRAMRGAS